MVYIQLNLPEDIDRLVDIESAKSGIKDKRQTVINILSNYFKKEAKE